jgi:hypothetical protein
MDYTTPTFQTSSVDSRFGQFFSKIEGYADLFSIPHNYCKNSLIDNTYNLYSKYHLQAAQFIDYSGNLALDWSSSLLEVILAEAEDHYEKFLVFFESFHLDLKEREKDILFDSILFSVFTGSFTTSFKYLVNKYFVDYDQNQTLSPRRPSILIDFFPRSLKLFLRRASFKNRNIVSPKLDSFVYTLFQGLKKGLLPIRPDQVDQSLKEHLQDLTTPTSIDADFKDFAILKLNEKFKSLIVPVSLKGGNLGLVILVVSLLSVEPDVPEDRLVLQLIDISLKMGLLF